MTPEDLMTPAEVESYLGVGKGWAQRNKHRLPHLFLDGKTLRFVRPEIHRWLDDQVVRPAGTAPEPAAPRPLPRGRRRA